MRHPRVQEKSVVVTGCSSGIGAATARFLRDRGWRVVPTARHIEDLDRLSEEGFIPVSLDLANSESVKQAAADALELLGGKLGGLVNNAGFAQPGAMEDVGRAALRAQFEANVFGPQELTNLLLPVFRGQGWGRIVNVSSAYGRLAVPMLGSYCASKFALEALSDALRVELRGSGVAVSIIEPGPIVTSMRRNAAAKIEAELDTEHARYGQQYEQEAARRKNQVKEVDFFTRPPEEVAIRIAHALESTRPKRRYCVTIPAHLAALASRFLPAAWIDRAVASQVPRT